MIDIFFHTLITLSEKFQLILSDITVNYERSKHVKFLHHVAQDNLALAISEDLKNHLDFDMFWSPLSKEVWIVLIFLCLAPSILMSAQDSLLNYEKFKLSQFFSRLFEAFAANFGGSFLAKNASRSNQLVIFSYFINGIIVWITYRASVVAVLSHDNLKFPFSDMKSFAQSDYLLLTQANGSVDFRFSKAKQGSIEAEIFKNNMDPERSYHRIGDGLQKILDNPKQAYFYYHISLAMLMGMKRCQYKFAYEIEPPDRLAMVMRPNDPDYESLNQAMIRMDKNGHLVKLRKYHRYHDQYHCKPISNGVKSITLEKLVSIFLFLIGAVIISLIVLGVEIVHAKCKKVSLFFRS